MTLEEARNVLARRPEWIRQAKCDHIEHWIREYLDTGGNAAVHSGQDPLLVAREILHNLNREASAAGDEPYPLTPEQLAAYLVVNTAERAERARQQRAANALVRQYAAAYEKAYDEQDPVVSVAEAARRLGISKKLIREHVKAGRIRAFQPGRAYKIRRSALEEFERATQVRVPGTICPACEERPAERGEALCQPCLESGRYLTCKCGAWAAYDELRARHGDELGGWAVVEEDEARYCPHCRPDDVEPGEHGPTRDDEEPDA